MYQKGYKMGLKKQVSICYQRFFILFIALIIRSLTLDDAMKGVTFFLQPDFSKVTSESILFAMGQSFFAISIGISIMITYSSYLNKKRKLAKIGDNNCWVKLICFSFLLGLLFFLLYFH
ncbi:hypothetical protein ACUIAK_15165 [Bacillus cytotoxicus]